MNCKISATSIAFVVPSPFVSELGHSSVSPAMNCRMSAASMLSTVPFLLASPSSAGASVSSSSRPSGLAVQLAETRSVAEKPGNDHVLLLLSTETLSWTFLVALAEIE